jgi:hypothetical protein
MEVMLTIHETLNWRDDIKDEIRFMEHLVSYAEYQFGERTGFKERLS